MSTYSEDSCKPYYLGVLNPCTYTYMYRVYLNPKEERVLVTRTKVAGEGWVLVTKHATWDKGIKDVEDLLRTDVVMVNRPRGTGTRALLDSLLEKTAKSLGVSLEELARGIRGYTHEVRTHTAVAAAVAQGRADVGVGVRYAAELYGLHFIPIGWEQYDLLARKEVLDKALQIAEEALRDLPRGYRRYEWSGKVRLIVDGSQ